MDSDIKDVLETVIFIKQRVEQLPGEDRVREIVREEITDALQSVHATLADINRRLDLVEEHYANLKGVTKEIDEIRAEVRAIQKHLGIEKRAAA
jgi:DNA-directed RNA polymerase beta' subunit